MIWTCAMRFFSYFFQKSATLRNLRRHVSQCLEQQQTSLPFTGLCYSLCILLVVIFAFAFAFLFSAFSSLLFSVFVLFLVFILLQLAAASSSSSSWFVFFKSHNLISSSSYLRFAMTRSLLFNERVAANNPQSSLE